MFSCKQSQMSEALKQLLLNTQFRATTNILSPPDWFTSSVKHRGTVELQPTKRT